MRQIAREIFPRAVSSAVSSVRRPHFLLDVEAQLATPYFRRSTENARRKNTAAKNKSPAEPGFCSLWFWVGLLRQLRNLMHKSRNLPARRVLVNDVALRRFHQLRLGTRHCLECCVAVTALDRFFDRSDRTAHLGAARFIDDGAAGNLARRLLGGSRIGHVSNVLRQ